MKRPNSILRTATSYVLSATVIAVLTAVVSFAWDTNTRLTRLETALISLSADVHDIKTLLQEKR